jgi:hypothetical protein
MKLRNSLCAFLSSFLISSIIFFSGCSKKKVSDESSQCIVRKHFDLPIPLTFFPLGSCTENFIKYHGKLSVAQAIAFYDRSMEIHGWDALNLSVDHEGFFYCKKPNKTCGIYLQALEQSKNGNVTSITFFIKPEE